jgi:hypothetical protein
VVVVRVYYEWKLFAPGMTYMSNMSDGLVCSPQERHSAMSLSAVEQGEAMAWKTAKRHPGCSRAAPG